MTTAPRRTQAERRAATRAKLLDATITCLVEHGYRDTSIGRICEEAGVSHGGLFRHYPSRTALVVSATDEVVTRHLAHLRSTLVESAPEDDMIDALVRFFRDAARSPMSVAWREVMVAARTNEELRVALRPAVQRFEDAVMGAASRFPCERTSEREFGTLILSLLHMFDSEASTAVVVSTPDVEALRHDWAVEIVRAALEKP